MSNFDPVTLARLRFLPLASADDYAAAVLDLNASLGKEVLAKADLPKGTELRTRLAIQDTSLAFNALTSILTSIADNEEQRENLVFLLAKAIDDSLNLGAFYMAGRPKEELPQPITAADIARKGGKRSVELRKAAIEEGWHKHARALALEIRAELPAIAQRPLSAEIGERWKDLVFKPGFDSLLRFVRDNEASGTIPRRKV